MNNLVPQFALTNAAGQIYMITPNPGNSFNGYQFIRSPYIQAPHPLQAPPQPIQHQLPTPQPRQIELQPLPPARVQSNTKVGQPQPLSKEETNAKIRNIKEKCITHYIDGQLIIETYKPLTEKKLKKKKLHPQQHQKHRPNQKQKQRQSQPNQLEVPQHHKPNQLLIQPQPAQPLSQAQPQQQQKQQNHHQQHIQLQIQSQQSQQQQRPSPQQQIPAPHQLVPQQQTQQLMQVQQHQVLPPQQQHTQPSKQPHQQQLQLPRQKLSQPKPEQSSQPQVQPQTKSQPTPQQLQPSELRKLRSEMASWSVSDVVKFIERHEEIRECSAKFAEDEVDGSALLFMIDRNLNFQTSNILTSMFKIGPAMKIEATLSKYKIND